VAADPRGRVGVRVLRSGPGSATAGVR